VSAIGPPRHQRSLPWNAAPYAAVDLELTGLEPSHDAIVSFAIVPVRDRRIMLSELVYRELTPDVPSSPAAINVHQLRAQDLAGNPTLADDAPTLIDALRGRFMLAWAAKVEVAFLRRSLGGSEREWRRRTIDVRELARAAERNEQPLPADYSLTSVAGRFGVPAERAHHALGDALMTAELFLVFAHRLSKGEDPVSVRRLLRISWRAARWSR
jgi:DNA polymerase III subunit epsilon